MRATASRVLLINSGVRGCCVQFCNWFVLVGFNGRRGSWSGGGVCLSIRATDHVARLSRSPSDTVFAPGEAAVIGGDVTVGGA